MPADILREEVRRLVAAGAQLVDVLDADAYRQEHIAGALSLPLDQLTRERAARDLRRDRPVIVYCNDWL